MKWTPYQDARLRRLYPTGPAWTVAVLLKRTLKQVERRVKVLGLSKQPRHPPAILERVRELHAEGLTDAAIAERVGLERRAVTWVRGKRLKLSVNREAIDEARQRAFKRQRESLGITCGGELRALGYRKYAESRGWPSDLAPRAVQMLDLLAAHQPLTRERLSELMGMAWHGSRSSLKSQRGSYLGELLRRGLVAYQRRSRPGPRNERRLPGWYWLTGVAMGMVEARLRRERDAGRHGDGGEHAGDDAGGQRHRRKTAAHPRRGDTRGHGRRRARGDEGAGREGEKGRRQGAAVGAGPGGGVRAAHA